MGSDELRARLDGWVADKRLMAEARDNVVKWLGSDRYADFHADIRGLIDREDTTALNDCFSTIIPFGTGGRRGTMGIGPNRINFRTIGESAQGLAETIAEQGDTARAAGCVIAHDTRNGSVDFARVCAEVLAASGVKVYYFDGFRSTPELSFAVRFCKATAGIMITASHNPPADNGFKAYWTDGGQVVPPIDKAIIAKVEAAGEIRQMPFAEAEERGLIVHVGAEIDEAYLAEVCALSLSPEREIEFVYTPLHGVGSSSIIPALERLGFHGMRVFERQAVPDGNFPTVPDHKPNPEEPKAMGPAVEYADSIGARLVLASDPDADRLAIACKDKQGNWVYPNGNQIGVLLADYTLRRLSERGELPENGYVVRTLVTTILLDAIAADYGLESVNILLVGFKWIADTIEKTPDKEFVFGFEESIGYLRSGFVRDKDATQAAIYMGELAARLAADGKTVLDRLDELYEKYGYYVEMQKSLYMTGAEGLRQIQAIMEAFRAQPPVEIAGHHVVEVIDRLKGEAFSPMTGKRRLVEGTKGNVLVFVLSKDGETRVSIRPSGTEPKIKHYVATAGRKEDGFASLATLKTMTNQKARDIVEDILELEKRLAG